ncbi:MAG TPA: SRPBCC domain-containing protein [Bacteroidia bacterium]|nr:SRPBCC domain-containing protein [Bacteroidia bacterium]
MSFPKTISKSITINAPASKVWHALTDPDSINEWLAENEIKVISEWKTGSPISFSGTWHGIEYNDKGTILKFETEKVFQYSYWNCFSNLSDSPENYYVIEFTLTPDGNQTRLTLTCSNIVTEAIYTHLNFYWTVTLDVIRKLIEK